MRYGVGFMYVSELLIRNYRSIKKERIIFGPGRNVLVGKNNSGKSNIIKALELVLGEKFPSNGQFEKKDFYNASGKQDDVNYFFIAVKLEGKDFNKEELRSIDKSVYCINTGKDSLIEKFYEDEDNEALSEEEKALLFEGKGSNKPYSYLKGDSLVNFFEEAEEFYIYLYVTNKITEETDDSYHTVYAMYVKKKDGYYYRITLSNKIRYALITCAILPSFRDPQDQFKINSWTWYGKLIKKLWESGDEEIKAEIQANLTQLKDKTQRIFKEAIEELKHDLEKAIDNHAISFEMLQNTKDDIYKNICIFVDDGINTPIFDKGSGIQSAMAIALFSYYCNEFHKNSSLLIVEEPEIYLHPQARRALSQRLDEFVFGIDNETLNQENNQENNNRAKNQVIITTHSIEFIKNTPLENIIVVRKTDDAGTKISRINTSKKDTAELQKIKNMIWTVNAELFFADEVILVEGGEFYLFPLVADEVAKEKKALEMKNISIIRVGGKSYFKSYVELLSELGIKWFIIADLDFLESGIEKLKEFVGDELFSQINNVKKIIGDIKQREKDKINCEKIKERCINKNNLDAKKFYEIVERICQNKEFDEELCLIWEYLKSKHGIKINWEVLENYKSESMKIYECIDRLKEKNIYILKKGEFDDYITQEGLDTAKAAGVENQKELRVIKLAEEIENKSKTLETLFDSEEFEQIMRDILNVDL